MSTDEDSDRAQAQRMYVASICKAAVAMLPESPSTRPVALNLLVAENARHLARRLQQTPIDIDLSQRVVLCLGVRRSRSGIDLQHLSIAARDRVKAKLSRDAASEVPPACSGEIPVYAECDGEYVLMSIPLPPAHLRPSRLPSTTARRIAF